VSKRYTYHEVYDFVNSLGYILLDDEYVHNKQKFTIVDDDGYYYYTNLCNLKNGRNPLAFFVRNPYTIQNLKLWIKLNKKPFELISNKYEGNNKYLKFKCLKCGEIFNATWSNIQSNWGCGYCRGFKVNLSNCLATKKPKVAVEWHPTKNGNLTPYNITPGSRKKVWWKCKKGHEWQATIKNRSIRQNTCPYCLKMYPTDDYNLLTYNPVLCEEWDYNKNKKSPKEYTPNSNKIVWWHCKKCGHKWSASILNRNFSKSGCPLCNFSKGETKIYYYLNNSNLKYYAQYRFKDCRYKIPLPFDFYLPDYNICIEYHGVQHYEPVKHFGGIKEFQLRQKLDEIKCNYCEDKNIKLLKIPYWDFDNIEQILDNYLFE